MKKSTTNTKSNHPRQKRVLDEELLMLVVLLILGPFLQSDSREKGIGRQQNKQNKAKQNKTKQNNQQPTTNKDKVAIKAGTAKGYRGP